MALEPIRLNSALRYPYEVRDEKPYFEDIPELKLPKEMLDLAAHIVETKSGHFDPSQFEDRRAPRADAADLASRHRW